MQAASGRLLGVAGVAYTLPYRTARDAVGRFFPKLGLPMKMRRLKIVALLATSSVILQLGGCGAALVQLVAQQLFAHTLRTVLDAALGNNNGTTTTP